MIFTLLYAVVSFKKGRNKRSNPREGKTSQWSENLQVFKNFRKIWLNSRALQALFSVMNDCAPVTQ